MKISTCALAAASTTLGAALAIAPAAGAAAAPSASAASYQQCWYGGTHTAEHGGGAQMQYYECRRGTERKSQQSSIKIRVIDTRDHDGKCGRAYGKVGYTWVDRKGKEHPYDVHLRVRVESCTTGHWSAWKRSGWWNGNQGFETVVAS